MMESKSDSRPLLASKYQELEQEESDKRKDVTFCCCCASEIQMPDEIDYTTVLLSDMKNQSTILEGNDKEGLVVQLQPELGKQYIVIDGQEFHTLWELLVQLGRKYKQTAMLGGRTHLLDPTNRQRYAFNQKFNTPARGPFSFLSFEETINRARHFGNGLSNLGLKKGDKIGIFSKNRAEWQLAALGIYSQGFTAVPLYDTLGVEAMNYIIEHARVQVVICSKEKLAQLQDMSRNCKIITNVIQFDFDPIFDNVEEDVDEEDRHILQQLNVSLRGFHEIIEMGKRSPRPQVSLDPEDLVCLMYTSGTTGDPKGVPLTNSIILSTINSMDERVEFCKFGIGDWHLSYLPLAHSYEFIVEVFYMRTGSTIVYYKGNIKEIAEDLSVARPSVFCGAPRVYQKFYCKILSGAENGSGIKKWIFNKAFESATQSFRSGQPRVALYDKLVFSKIRAALGLDRCRLLVSGSAPLADYLQEFMQVIMNKPFIQGYGLTETCALTAVQFGEYDYSKGSVGAPMLTTKIKLCDVPEMNYTSKDIPCPRGEIAVKGGNVFKGYYNNDKENKKAFDSDGWFHTGDIARLNPNGSFTIIDRKKNIFKLLQGEYVAVEKLEMIFSKASMVGQIWVYGNSFKSCILAVIVPDPEHVMLHAIEHGWWPRNRKYTLGSFMFASDFKTLCDNHIDAIHELVLHDIQHLGREAGLFGFEIPRGIILETSIDELCQGFSVENDCLTPTFKLRRPNLYSRYKNTLITTYADLGEPDRPGDIWPDYN